MKTKIPNPQFQEKEVDRLIVAFGVKTEPEKKLDLKVMLAAEKGKFLEQERTREARNRDDRTHD